MKPETYNIIIDTCLFITVFILGIFTILAYQAYNHIGPFSLEVKVYGVWTQDLSKLQTYSGSFICINIDETKTLKQLQNTVNHEIGHEIWARYCEDNIDKCINITEDGK